MAAHALYWWRARVPESQGLSGDGQPADAGDEGAAVRTRRRVPQRLRANGEERGRVLRLSERRPLADDVEPGHGRRLSRPADRRRRERRPRPHVVAAGDHRRVEAGAGAPRLVRRALRRARVGAGLRLLLLAIEHRCPRLAGQPRLPHRRRRPPLPRARLRPPELRLQRRQRPHVVGPPGRAPAPPRVAGAARPYPRLGQHPAAAHALRRGRPHLHELPGRPRHRLRPDHRLAALPLRDQHCPLRQHPRGDGPRGTPVHPPA